MSEAARFSSCFEIDDATRICVVSLAGNLDPEAVGELHPQVQELFRAGYRLFVFDMSSLDYVGSLGLRLLVGLSNQVKGEGSATLCQMKDGVRSVIEMTKLDLVLTTFPSRDAAVAAATSGTAKG